MAQQTAVEWLVDWMGKNQYFIGNDLLQAYEQAKQMEKEQIFNAFGVGCQVESKRLIGYHGMAEQYYNEKYVK